MNIDALGKITPTFALNTGIFFLSFLCPGFLLWFVVAPELIVKLDFLKLCVLSVAVSAPPFVAGYFMSLTIYSVLKHRKHLFLSRYGDHADWYFRHGVGNALNMYTVVFLTYTFNLSGFSIALVILGSFLINIIAEIMQMARFLRDPAGLASAHLHRPSAPGDPI